MKSIEAGWEIGFPASTVDELLVALVVRDLVHGASFDVEAIDDGSEMALDFTAGDELEGETYRLLLSAEVAGSDNREMIQAFAEEMLEGLVAEAEETVGHRKDIGSRPACDLVFRTVPEDEERWDLVIPDWLAPDGSEVPFGFRSYDAETARPWPDNADLDDHGRVVLVPFDGGVYAFGIPAPTGWNEDHDEGASKGLPLHPDGPGTAGPS
jgi:hypothetical protein